MKIRRNEEAQEYSKRLWEQFYDSSDKATYWFDIITKKRIGALCLKVTEGVCYIKDLILEENHRGKGHGRKTIQFIDDFAAEKGCHKIRVKTCPELMPAAFHLYNKNGFQIEATLEDDYQHKTWVILSKYI